jgi:hypothetical protein
MWDGVAWSLATTPAVAEPHSLSGVSCTSPTSCVAVGEYEGGGVYHTLVEAWNGSAWSVVASPNEGTAGSVLQDVSCADATTCTAAGYFSADGAHPLIEMWNGATWSIVPNAEPPNATTTLLRGVSCPSAATCFAVGWYQYFVNPGVNEEIGTQTFVEKWNGTKWSIKHAADPGSKDNKFHAVSCAAGNRCTAVGYSASGIGPLIEMWDGTSWTVADRPNPGKGYNELTGVSCPSRTRCVAVGQYYSADRGALSKNLVERWDGSTWTVARSFSHPAQNDYPQGVSCATVQSCHAVGITYPGSGFDSFALEGKA